MSEAGSKLFQKGFTLTEVLIAMFILSTAIVSLLALVSQNIRITADLEQAFLAEIVADNVMTETLVPYVLPGNLPLQGETSLGGQNWRWTRQIEETVIEGFFRVKVTVYPEEGEQVAGFIVAFREGG